MKSKPHFTEDYNIIIYTQGKQIDNEGDKINLVAEAEKYVQSIYDRYDVLFIEENIKSAKEHGKVISVNYTKPKSIYVKELNQSLLCRSIIIPLHESFPSQSIIVINDKMIPTVYAARR